MASIQIHPDNPVLIAGPTASGKSALALRIAQEQGGVVVNADALQVYDAWQILTARPSEADMAGVPHALYGIIPHDTAFSVGDWLPLVTQYLRGQRPIIVGGTGLYFSALTEGLAAIPAIPPEIRTQADAMSLPDMISDLDPLTASGIDLANRARVQRAWEVVQATGQSLRDWQHQTPAPILPLAGCTPIVINAPKDWLTPRIAQRFDIMLDQGLIAETTAMRPIWNPRDPASKAIGAAEMIAHRNGDLTMAHVRDAVVIGTRQYAKRQRTWFKRRMAKWHSLDMSSTDLSTALQYIS